MTRYTVRAQGPDGTWKAYVVAAGGPASAVEYAWEQCRDSAWTALAVEPAPEGEVLMAIDLDEEGA